MSIFLCAIVKKNNKVCLVEYAFLNYDRYIHLTEGGGEFSKFFIFILFSFLSNPESKPPRKFNMQLINRFEIFPEMDQAS